MSQTMEEATERPDEDSASLKSNGKTPTKDAVKGTLNSFRRSFRRVMEKSPRSSGAKGSKVASRANANDLGSPQSPTPPSPSE